MQGTRTRPNVFINESELNVRLNGENSRARECSIEQDLAPGALAFSFIKAGYEDRYQDVVDTFREHGLTVLHAEKVTLSPEAVDQIYCDSKDEHFYPAMKDYLTDNEVIAMVVIGHGQDTQDDVSSFKHGADGYPNLREQYCESVTFDDEEIELWWQGAHPNQDDVSVELTQNNVLHCADTPDEAMESIRLVFGDNWINTAVRSYCQMRSSEVSPEGRVQCRNSSVIGSVAAKLAMATA
jgi:nucleoside diphosphate kinase